MIESYRCPPSISTLEFFFFALVAAVFSGQASGLPPCRKFFLTEPCTIAPMNLHGGGEIPGP